MNLKPLEAGEKVWVRPQGSMGRAVSGEVVRIFGGIDLSTLAYRECVRVKLAGIGREIDYPAAMVTRKNGGGR